MNDYHAELNRIVERVVRPVSAAPARKKLIREELMAHVTDVFAEEKAHHGNERTALANTCRRFGVLEELERELQESVPFYERLWSSLEKEHLMSHKLWLAAGAAIAVGLAIVMPATALYKNKGIVDLFPLMIGVSVTLAGFALCAYGVKQHFARPARATP